MRHNFVNDIGDYGKYALLRASCSSARSPVRLGVIWYLTEHAESNGDGRQRAHLSRQGWEGLDADLLARMRKIEGDLGDYSNLHLGLIERSGILPADTVFFSEAMPDIRGPADLRIARRAAWFTRARKEIAGCDLVFLDPDNGLETQSVKPTSRLAGKYATVAEVTDLLSSGIGVILYQHCNRTVWRAQRDQVQAKLASGLGRPLSVRSLRFGAFGARAFFCMSVDQRLTETMDQALEVLHRRIASWDKAHYFLFE
jgi:hypothetical protein